jgi:hypothetical protein
VLLGFLGLVRLGLVRGRGQVRVDVRVRVWVRLGLVAYPNWYYTVLQVPPSTRRTLDVQLGVLLDVQLRLGVWAKV